MVDKTLYYVKDKNDNFVRYDYESECLFATGELYNACNFSNQVRATDFSFNKEEEWKDGEIGKTNVDFPLRAVKVTLNYVVEELEEL